MAKNRWDIEGLCLVSHWFEGEDGEMGRGNREATQAGGGGLPTMR